MGGLEIANWSVIVQQIPTDQRLRWFWFATGAVSVSYVGRSQSKGNKVTAMNYQKLTLEELNKPFRNNDDVAPEALRRLNRIHELMLREERGPKLRNLIANALDGKVKMRVDLKLHSNKKEKR